MDIDADAAFRAVRAKDRRFDGRLFVGISSTGIYCRPICPARPPKRSNMHFFNSAAAAESQGFRPCLRCRPERAPGYAPVDALDRLVFAAVANIEEHSLSSAGVGELAAKLGVSDRHLRRATQGELGVSPIQLAQTQRLLLAKRLIAETRLPLTEVAFASGFGSVRRFDALFKSRYHLSPRSMRRGAAASAGLRCQLEFRPPFAWQEILGYLGRRAVPSVEHVDRVCYRRTAAIGKHQGWIAVSLSKTGHSLDVEIADSLTPVVAAVLARVRRLFDLNATPGAVAAHLLKDPDLAPAVRRIPGLRVPGAFDPFELAVRAILGQQVSVAAATTLAGRWARKFGAGIETPFAELTHLCPTPSATAGTTLQAMIDLGLVRKRAECIRELAQSLVEQRLSLTLSADVSAQIEALRAIPGIGAWTAEYIAMRAMQWPDAFPSTDLVLMRAAGASARELNSRAEKWRPWRAYAAHYLWQSAGAQ